jgi:hypothetical protein
VSPEKKQISKLLLEPLMKTSGMEEAKIPWV